MKTRLFFPLFFVLICVFAGAGSLARAQEAAAKPSPAVILEVLRHEISLLKMLLANLSAKNPIDSLGYIAVDLESGKILLSKNPNKVFPIASITKMMNAVVARENVDENKIVALDDAMLSPLGSSPSLYEGLAVSVKNLLQASLIQSANDAAEALAQTVGKENFLALMNQKAKDLRMENTAFFDACGLDPRNRSTPADLAKLVGYVYKNHPEILAITKSNDFWLPDQSGALLKFQNVNNFYLLPAFIGGKTGYLPEAKQTIAGVFNANGKPAAIIVLHSSNRQADVFRILEQINN